MPYNADSDGRAANREAQESSDPPASGRRPSCPTPLDTRSAGAVSGGQNPRMLSGEIRDDRAPPQIPILRPKGELAVKKNGLTRRNFVQGASTLALGGMVVPRHVLGGVGYQAPSDTLNVAIVGAGGRGIPAAPGVYQRHATRKRSR